jgi:peptidoglycan hydrolase-like protein with peptidoglycan-binding domain
MPTPKGPLAKRAGVGLAVAAAIAAGTLVARDQLTTNASRATSQNRYAQLQAAASGKDAAYLGPLARNHRGMAECGRVVRLMEGALRRTTPPIRKTPALNCIGVATERQIKAFQKRHHIPQSGIYGKRTHEALAHAYSAQQRADLAYIAAARLKQLRYDTIGIVTAHARALQGRMVYCNYGSLSSCGSRWNWPAWPDVPRHTDCSGYVTWVYYQSGLPDPNGLGYTGGYTGTLITHGVSVPRGAPLHIGDLIINGGWPSGSHVSIYIGHGLSSGHGRFGIQIHQWNYRAVLSIRRNF